VTFQLSSDEQKLLIGKIFSEDVLILKRFYYYIIEPSKSIHTWKNWSDFYLWDTQITNSFFLLWPVMADFNLLICLMLF